MISFILTTFGKVSAHFPIVDFSKYVFFQEGPGLRKWQWTDSGMKVINVTNIIGDGSVDTSNTDRFIAQSEFQTKYFHFAIEANDILVASSGNTYGKVGRIRNDQLPVMMNTSVIRMHPLDNQTLSPNFLYAYIRSPLFRNQIEQFVIGSAQPNFGPYHLNRMKIILPSYTIQQKIAAILSAYDDLIENNTRRIRILEEMAQAIYREWFINFRFPGHESVRMVESELGPVPEGWEVRKIGDIIELQYGKGLKTEDRKEGLVPVYGSSGIIGYHNRDLVKGPGVVVGRKGNVGSVFWSDTDFFPIDTVYYVKTKLPLHYIFFNLQKQNFLNNDAAVPGLNRNQAYSLPFLIPDSDTLIEFEKLSDNFFNSIKSLERKNANLRRTRDLLLPKLISGEIDVSGLDIRIPEAEA
jgi:type I restriction enzyme, S subunit